MRSRRAAETTGPLRIDVLPGDSLTARQRAEIIALCSRAYEEDFSSLFDDFAATTHVLANVGRRWVSHALWIERPLFYNGARLRSAYVEAVATEPAHQRRGYASAVLRALALAIGAYDIGALSPSDPAFYARLGWELWQGSLFVERDGRQHPTPDEVVMVLRLPNTPPLDVGGTLAAPWRKGDIW
jgi:aminoglycoside 2'-N-acetyltransferase I